MKTYVWLSAEKLKFINNTPAVLSLLYDLGLLPEEIGARVRGYVEEERENCAKIALACDACPCCESVPEAIAARIRALNPNPDCVHQFSNYQCEKCGKGQDTSNG